MIRLNDSQKVICIIHYSVFVTLFTFTYLFCFRENVVKCQSFYRCNLLQCRNVEIFLVAENEVAQRFSLDALLLEVYQISKRQLGNTLIECAVDVVVYAEVLGVDILVEYTGLCRAVCSKRFHQTLLCGGEQYLRLWQRVGDFAEHPYAVHEFVVLRYDVLLVILRLFLVVGRCVCSPRIVGQSACFAQLLKDDSVHRTTEVFVEQTDQRFCDDVAEMIRQAGR